MAVPGKQYGLILPQKSSTKSTALSRPSIFGDDSDDETSVGKTLQKEAVKKKMMKQTRLEMQKALDQDSSVYEYDAVYDDIQKQRLESSKKALTGIDKKPKYINQLLKAVEERKKEQERRDERKIQKEREAEGDQFADKEAYVTSAYRQKLKEREEELEREKRQAQIEAALDVKKQKDLSGFYRHLLNQTVGEESVPDRSAQRDEKANSTAPSEKQSSPPPSPPAHDSDSHSDQEQKAGKTEFNKSSVNSAHSKRQYRQRSPSSGSGDERPKEKGREREKKSHKHRERDRGRDRGKDDRHSHRRDDKEHRRDRERDKERTDDRSKGRKDRERERDDRHGKRDRREASPRDKEGDKNGEREREKEGEGHKVKEKEKYRGEERVKAKEDKDREKTADGHSTEKEKSGPQGEDTITDSAPEPSKFAKRSSEQTVSSARDRYLARQLARSAVKTYIEKEED
ncbi:nuclear speckle splicing regulatory protein 1 [Denticeps clupeoides]|uniref:Nuclear speckle splicing regulatory protein 1 n=1 Tax=Denticeps clupeoides TaxID=299321 RepID=A0AAY4ARB1_9TELE|nr:nuclear speckle splicing regulatory protein 1 [Denticeps clupeoides]